MHKRWIALLMVLLCMICCGMDAQAWMLRDADDVFFSREKAQRDRVWEILSRGTLLFEGETHQAYEPEECEWLQQADHDDLLVILYTCDDEIHAGWDILGLEATVNEERIRIDSIQASVVESGKDRWAIYSIDGLVEAAGADSASAISGISIDVWHSGRIAGLYYLTQPLAGELQACLADIEEQNRIVHTYTGALSNDHAIESAQKVYAYIRELGEKNCLTGQMEADGGNREAEMDYLWRHTGRLPAVRGFDFLNDDFAGVTQRALQWWKMGGIVTICWHTGPEFTGGLWASRNGELNWNEAFEPGSDAYHALLEGMDRAVPYLQKLEDEGVAVLWKPFHEFDGGWFWWSRGGSENFVKLWRLMYSRYTEYWGLNNLIWVLGYSQVGEEMESWYPGDRYVDIVGADTYENERSERLYAGCKAIAPQGMPLILHECAGIPLRTLNEKAPWSMFMVWHGESLYDLEENPLELLRAVYGSEYFVTLDELPSFLGGA